MTNIAKIKSSGFCRTANLFPLLCTGCDGEEKPDSRAVAPQRPHSGH